MKKPSKVVVSKQRTVHTYSELWHASNCVLEAGINEPRGSTWQFLSSAVLTAFAFEAYLNHVGPTVINCWSELERLPPWAKFELLCENLAVNFPKGVGSRPLQTVSQLLSFRNTIAHGRSEELNPKPEHRDNNENLYHYMGEVPRTNWESLVRNKNFAQRARKDVESVLKVMHMARPEPKEFLFSSGMGSHSAESIYP